MTVSNARWAIAALEDKIVQKATVAVLNSIYEENFLGASAMVFGQGRDQHEALDALHGGDHPSKSELDTGRGYS